MSYQFKIQQRNQIIRTNLILVLNNICIFSLKLHKCITPYEKTTDDDYNAMMTMTKSNDDYEYNYDTTTTATTTTTTTTTTTRRMMKHSWQTAASYRGPGEDEDKDSYAARIAFTGNSRILGPICIVVGALMLALGILLCMLTRRARRRERRVGFHCPLHGDFYPVSPVQSVKMLGVSGKSASGWPRIPCLKSRTMSKAGANGSHVGPPQCPHSVLSSTRSSVSSSPLSPCPTPMPFLVTSGSVSSGMVQSVGANLSPDQTFGSIRSLSVTREVASFPLSRTPTPPPQHRPSLLQSNNDDLVVGVGSPLREASPRPEVRVVAPAHRPPSGLVALQPMTTNNLMSPRTINMESFPEDS
ncbi:hypothetical protein HZH68_011150 [Vespula germanica]|uniref:Uncharacterized protein n=1 Tax=Vespula germanica TaxID=30212 RepID=A0A834N069_VESGE|nr:hypothetical protein HZH68_011150 [Vespula germanica]